jgi:sulfide:quinone oxidoreductase
VSESAARRRVPGRDKTRVVIVGGGVAALEAALSLRHLAEDGVAVTLLSPERVFRYRPASVAVAFGRGEVYGYDIADLAATVGATLELAALVQVDALHHRVATSTGAELDYDVLVVACGASRASVLKGALEFGGEEDTAAMRSLLVEVERGRVRRVVFALPRGASWAVPLYELALLTASHVQRRRLSGIGLELVTPEERPLAQFGGDVSTTVAQLLSDRGIRLRTGTYPVAVYPGRLVVIPYAVVAADRVVSVPAARGVPISGLPSDREGFLATDAFGRVTGADDVFAAGDVTAHPIKQGGIAAQQAGVVAHTIAYQIGATAEPPAPFRPVLRGLLLTGEEPQYLTAHPTGGKGDTAEATTDPLWWPGGKIAAPMLASYLATAPRLRDE